MEYLIFTCIGNEFNIAMGITELHYAWSLTPGQGTVRLVLNTFYVPKHPSWFMQILRLV